MLWSTAKSSTTLISSLPLPCPGRLTLLFPSTHICPILLFHGSSLELLEIEKLVSTDLVFKAHTMICVALITFYFSKCLLSASMQVPY